MDLNTIVNNFEFRRTKNLLLYVDEICIKISKNSFAKMLLFVCPQPSPKGSGYIYVFGERSDHCPEGAVGVAHYDLHLEGRSPVISIFHF